MSGTQPEASAAAKAQAEAQAIEVGLWVGTKCGTNPSAHKSGQCTLCKRCRRCPSHGCPSDKLEGHGRGEGDRRRRSAAEDKDASPATIRTLPDRTAALAISVGAYADLSAMHIGIKMQEEQGGVSMQDKVSDFLLLLPVVRLSYCRVGQRRQIVQKS
jgi:hypothetical protein